MGGGSVREYQRCKAHCIPIFAELPYVCAEEIKEKSTHRFCVIDLLTAHYHIEYKSLDGHPSGNSTSKTKIKR